jgi:hypothetical protein
MCASWSVFRREAQRFLRNVLLMLLIVFPPHGIAEYPKAASEPNDGIETVLQSHLDALKVSIAGAAGDATLRVSPPALLKYSDPARRYLAGGVWRIGKSGRPKGLVALELWPDDANPRRGKLHHELSSFESDGLDATSTAGIAWHPRTSVLELKPLADAPRPAQTAER